MPTMSRRPTLAAIAVIAIASLGLAACGGGETTTLTIEEGVTDAADPESVEVIEEWSSALADGDVEAAASFFAIPSVAENGPVGVRIRDRADAERFNESLPCGAELIRAQGHAGFVLATFRLTERPGPGTCGDGVGATAGTAFRIVDGEIAEWRRIGVPGGGEGEQPPSNAEVV